MSNSVKYLAPWHKQSETIYWRYPIQLLDDGIEWKWRAEIWYRSHQERRTWEVVYRRIDRGTIELLGYFSSYEEAIDAADQKLKDLGYVFLTKEQYEKMQVLL